MKISNPISRFHLPIKRRDHVLEVGCGHDPNKRANVVCDKFVDINTHRSGDLKILPHQKFYQADGEDLPFEDNQFDYAICTHVLEHVDNPIAFMKEQTRVAKRGYLEIPSFVGEYLVPKASHKWAILEIDEKIVLMDKELIGFKHSHDFGDLFLDFMPRKSIAYKLLQRTYGNLLTVRYEWEGDIEVIVNPTEEKYTKFFTKNWDLEMMQSLFPQRSLGSELRSSAWAFADVVKSVFQSKVLKPTVA